MKKKYDYLIVGAGIFGSVCAYELSKKGKKCLVIDKRDVIGGNCYTENIEGINVHKYGPHIFHTSDKRVWDYVNNLVPFNHFSYRPKIKYKDKIYSLPINLMSFPFIAKASYLLFVINISVLTGKVYDIICSGFKLLTLV